VEDVEVVPYDPNWSRMFEEEKQHLLNYLPRKLLGRIEHFGSTSIPGLSAKPIVDVLVEVTSLEEAKRTAVPILEAQGYDYFWRSVEGDEEPPFYAWFHKRDEYDKRTHHIHMVEDHFEHWDRLYFRNYLTEFPEIAQQYEDLKTKLAQDHEKERLKYAKGKKPFIFRVTKEAKEYYLAKQGE